MNIEKIVKALNFDDIDDDMFAEFFDKKQIEKDFSFEDAILNAFEVLPKDYLWYLKNYGCRTVRNMEFKVQIDDNTVSVVPFEGLTSPSNATLKYRYHTCTGSYKYRFEDENIKPLADKYLPITSENDDKVTVLDFKEKVGSIWQFPSKVDCEKYNLEYVPSFVAESFTDFLVLIKPSHWSNSYFKKALLNEGYKETEEYSGLYKKKIKTARELFYKKLNIYKKNNAPSFTEFKNLEEFIIQLSADASHIIRNDSRAVELFHVNNFKVNNLTFEDEIKRIQNFKSKLTIKRQQPTTSALKHLTNNPYRIGSDHHFYKTTVKSTINGMQSEEDFVLYKNPETQLLSFVKIIDFRIEDLKIKDLGTFEYDSYWSSKKAKKTKWSKIPAKIHLQEDTDNFTEDYFDFIRKTINDESLKEKLETFLYEHYQKNDYAEFLEMSPTDVDYFEGNYPKVTAPSKIWKALGETFDIYFINNKTFKLQFEYTPDDEHGLSLTVVNDKIQLN